MQYLEKRSPLEEPFTLMPLGDLHIGENSANYKEIRRYLNYALTNNISVVGMGDLLNCATKSSPGKGPFDQQMTTTEQYNYAVSLLRPLSEKGLLLGLLAGNHEERISKDGMDITQMLSSALNVPYLGYSAVIKVVAGRNSYIVYLTHGGGASTAISGVISKIEKLNQLIDADLYLKGHDHKLLEFTDVIRRLDVRNNKLIDVTRHYVGTGAFLDYDDTYGEEKNYKMHRKGASVITFSGERGKKDITVRLTIDSL